MDADNNSPSPRSKLARSPLILITVVIGLIGLTCGGVTCGILTVRNSIQRELVANDPFIKSALEKTFANWDPKVFESYAADYGLTEKGKRETAEFFAKLRPVYGNIVNVGKPKYLGIKSPPTKNASETDNKQIGGIMAAYDVPMEFEKGTAVAELTVRNFKATRKIFYINFKSFVGKAK